MLNFKISSLAKIDLLKITLNSCEFKIYYRFYITFIDCKNTFLVLLLILTTFFWPFSKKVNGAFNTKNLSSLLAIGNCYAEFVGTSGSDPDTDFQTSFSFVNLEHISSSRQNQKL